MPFYEYRCEACGHEMEALQKVSDPPLSECPACGRGTLKKLISAAGFRLKGGGWYETDFKKKGDKKRNLHGESGTGGGTADAGKSADKAKKAEAKPAAKGGSGG